MGISRSISLVIGRAIGRKVQRVIGPRRGSREWTRRVSFDMKRRTGSRAPAALRDSQRRHRESVIMSIVSVDLLNVSMGSLDAARLRTQAGC
jgi:hypothetical protein